MAPPSLSSPQVPREAKWRQAAHLTKCWAGKFLPSSAGQALREPEPATSAAVCQRVPVRRGQHKDVFPLATSTSYNEHLGNMNEQKKEKILPTNLQPRDSHTLSIRVYSYSEYFLSLLIFASPHSAFCF